MLGAFEPVDPLLSGREQGPVAGLAGLDRQRRGEVRLSGASFRCPGV